MAHWYYLDTMPDKNGWIKVSDELPDDGIDVIGFRSWKPGMDYVERVSCHYDSALEGWFTNDGDRIGLVTHWQDWPADPEDES